MTARQLQGVLYLKTAQATAELCRVGFCVSGNACHPEPVTANLLGKDR